MRKTYNHKKEAFPIQENLGLRSANSRIFPLGNNEYILHAHSNIIHYLSNGKFLNIDNTLLSSRDGWRMEKSGFLALIPRFADGKLIMMNACLQEPRTRTSQSAGVLDFITRPVDVLHVEGNLIDAYTVLYSNAYGDGIDLHVSCKGDAFTKEVVIREKPRNTSDLKFTFELALPEGTDVKLNAEQQRLPLDTLISTQSSIVFESSKKTFVRDFVVVDALGNRDPDMRVDLVKKGNVLSLTKVISKEFLDRAIYPISCDHVFSYSATGGTGYVIGQASTWAACRGATTGIASGNALTNSIMARETTTYRITRGFISIDTDALPPDTVVSAATLYQHSSYRVFEDNDTEAYAGVVNSTATSGTTLVDANYNDLGTSKGANDIALPALAVSGYNEFVFNATGRGWVSLVGYTFMGLREGHDLENISIALDKTNSVDFSGQTAGDPPYLSVTFTGTFGTAPAQGWGNLADKYLSGNLL